MKLHWKGYGQKFNGPYQVTWNWKGIAHTDSDYTFYTISNSNTGRILLRFPIYFKARKCTTAS
jgi:hypothetical protein